MRGAKAVATTEREPAWQTALAEADAARRQVGQAATSLDRLSGELRALREWAETTVRLELARDVTDGPDGGALNALLTASKAPADAGLRRTAEILLDRLTSALGLEPIVEKGEYLMLLPKELGEFEVRERLENVPPEGHRALYCVVRPGWWLGDLIVVRPLLEPVSFPIRVPEMGTIASATRSCPDRSDVM